MISLIRHTLTPLQLQIIHTAVRTYIDTITTPGPAEIAAEDLLETLNADIQGGKQTVYVEYEREE